MIKIILVFITLIAIILLGCEPYIYDCVLGNTSLRDENYQSFLVNHPDMNDKDFERAWDELQGAMLQQYNKMGICDKVVYGRYQDEK